MGQMKNLNPSLRVIRHHDSEKEMTGLFQAPGIHHFQGARHHDTDLSRKDLPVIVAELPRCQRYFIYNYYP